MRLFLLRRVLQLIPTLFLISIVSFAIIQLPPGDYLTTYVANLAAAGEIVTQEEIDGLYQQYGLDRSVYVQYWKWITKFLRGDMGRSFYWDRPVNRLIGERIALTMTLSFLSLLFAYAIVLELLMGRNYASLTSWKDLCKTRHHQLLIGRNYAKCALHKSFIIYNLYTILHKLKRLYTQPL